MSTKPLFPCPQIQRAERIYVAWVNSDRTEGRGYQYPLAVAQYEETARRLGRGQDVQGCDATVVEDYALLVLDGNVTFYVPGFIVPPSKEDLAVNKANQEKAKAQKIFEEAVARAKQIGLSEEDIKILQGATK